MPSTQSIEAGRAFLKLFVDDNEFRRGLTGAARGLDQLAGKFAKAGAVIGAAGAAITAPLVASVKIFTSLGSELNDISQRTGATVESLSELKFAAEQSGTSIATVEAGFRVMARQINNANSGVDASVALFSELGVSLAELNSLSVDGQFNLIARALGRIESPTQRAALAMKVLGRSGTQLLPLIADLDELRAKAQRLGLVMTSEGVAAADKLDDAFALLKATVSQVGIEIGNALAPELTRITEGLAESASGAAAWVKENQQVVIVAGAAALAMNKIAVALTGAASGLTLAAAAGPRFLALLAAIQAHPAIAALAGLAATLAIISSSPAAGPTPLADLDPLDIQVGIDQSTRRIAELKKEIAAFVPVANEMDKLIQDLARHNLILAESELKALQAEKSRRINAQRGTLPALRDRLPALGQAAGLPSLSDADKAKAEKERAEFYASLLKKAAPGLNRAIGPDLPLTPESRFQFGGRGIEQSLGTTNERKQTELLAKIEKHLDRATVFKVGNA